LESVKHIIKKKVEEVAIVSVEKPVGYLVALVSLCSFFFLLLVLFLHFVSSNCQYVLALLFNFASLLDCANHWFECSLPKTPHTPTTSRLCFCRQSLRQSFTGATCLRLDRPCCLVRTDKNLITAL
jgi:hypothetical protein